MKGSGISAIAMAALGLSFTLSPVWGMETMLEKTMSDIEQLMQKPLDQFPPFGPCPGRGADQEHCNAIRCGERHNDFKTQLSQKLNLTKEIILRQQEALNQTNALLQQTQQTMAANEQNAAAKVAQYDQTIREQALALDAAQKQLQALIAENQSLKNNQGASGGGYNPNNSNKSGPKNR